MNQAYTHTHTHRVMSNKIPKQPVTKRNKFFNENCEHALPEACGFLQLEYSCIV